jgi:hypothetical protein
MLRFTLPKIRRWANATGEMWESVCSDGKGARRLEARLEGCLVGWGMGEHPRLIWLHHTTLPKAYHISGTVVLVDAAN